VRVVSFALGGFVLGMAPQAHAQAVSKQPPDQQRQARYQVSQMERMLEGAVEHGATVVRERFQVATGAQGFVNDSGENAHVRGFRLEGFGVFFDIEVPSLSLQGTLLWSLQTLDQNGLALDNALSAIRNHLEAAGDANLLQALKRVELQVAPVAIGPRLPLTQTSVAPGPRPAARVADGAVAEARPDPVLTDPQEAYRSEVQKQIIDALLDYSHPLAIGPDEWLMAGARSHIDRPLLAPADSDARTIVVRVRGRDLLAFHAGQLSREDAIKRVEVRVF
jgi:hypothetical protein